MRDKPLPFSPPLIGPEEICEVVDTLRSGWITTGPKVRRFEDAFAAYVGAPVALALNSCTAALHVALAALGIGPGDAVLTTPMTFCSTVHVIEHVGARPVFVDVESDTLNIDPTKAAAALEKAGAASESCRVRAILPVHLHGHPCDMNPILEIAEAAGLAIIEDAAHALPARYGDHLVGSGYQDGQTDRTMGPIILSCFSFYATKNLTTGEGGMLTGGIEQVEEARLWSLHGMSRDAWKRYTAAGSWYYEVVRPGFKYNMTDIQAAIGLHQLSKLDQFLARRREIVRLYDEAFSQHKALECPTERTGVQSAWHIYALRLCLSELSIGRAGFIEELKARNISSSVHFIPVHLHPYYRDKYGYRPEDFPVAFREYKRLVSLPLHVGMSHQDVQDVIDAVLDVTEQYRA